MTDKLPAGYEILDEETSPALPAGFSLLDDPIEDVQPKKRASLETNMKAAAMIDPRFMALRAAFGEKSNVGRLSEKQQFDYVEKKSQKAIGNLSRAKKKIAELEAAGPPEYDPLQTSRATGITNIDHYKNRLSTERGRLRKAEESLSKVNGILQGEEMPPEFGPIKNAVAGAMKSFANSFTESLPKAAGAVQATITGQEPEETLPYRFGQAASEIADDVLYTDAVRQDETLQQVGQGLGQAGSMMVPGGAAKVLGMGAKGRAGVMAGVGAAQSGAAGLDDALAFDATTSQKLISFYGNAGLGLSEAVPLSRMFSRLNKSSGGKVQAILTEAGTEGIEEAIQEIGQTIGSNAIASELAQYDQGRELLDGAAQGGKVGAIVGALLGGSGAAITRQSNPNTGADVKAEDVPDGFEVVPEGDMPKPPVKRIKAAEIRDDVAIDPAGNETKVKYAIVEAGDLITSHNDDLNKNDAYPQILQPRDRSRPASATQVNNYAANLKPELLGESPQAESGSPIISSDGVVESGNARSMAIRKAYGAGNADAYRDYLKAQGYPVDGYKNPVLVRIAPDERTEGERIAFTRNANGMTAAAMSVTERAMTDARALDATDFEVAQYGSSDIADDMPFVRRVLSKITNEAERGQFIDSAGRLSVDGRRRIEAAVTAYAYDDGALVSNLMETSDEVLQGLGKQLVSAAPGFAKLKSGIASGDIDARVDISPAIKEASGIAVQARRDGKTIKEQIAISESDMFKTEQAANLNSVLGVFFDDKGRQRSQAAIRNELRYYAQEAQKASTAPSLLGDDGVDPSRRIFDAIENSRNGGKPLNVYEVEGDNDGKPLFDKAPKTDSAAFKRWFGDSKVVDEDGAPLVVYHGTGAKDLSQFAFDKDRIGAQGSAEGRGFYFTDDKSVADGYGSEGSVIKAYLSIKKPMPYDEKAFDEETLVNIVVEVARLEALENDEPIAYGFLSNFADAGEDATVDDIRWIAEEAAQSMIGEETAIEQFSGIAGTGVDPVLVNDAVTNVTGFDGVVSNGFDNLGTAGGGTIYVAFNPNQIKSVDNRGTFDIDDDRILYDKATPDTDLPEGFALMDDPAPVGGGKPKQKSRGRQARRASATPVGKKVGHDGETPGLHEITNKIRKRFGAIARQGRMGMIPKSVLGFYRPATGVIRTRQSYLAEIDTFAHEVGHDFDRMNEKNGLKALMKKHAIELIPMDYDPARKDKKVALKEGFAEFFTAYITNPAYARSKAPKFAAEFNDWLDDTHKGLRQDINEFSKQYLDWLTAPSAASVASNVVDHPKTGGMGKAVEKTKEQGLKSYAGTILNQGVENFIDRLNPMKLAVNSLNKLYRENTGRHLNLKASSDPYKMLRLAENSANKGVMAMFDGVIPYRSADPKGASLQDAIMTAVGNKKKWTQDNVKNFDAYLVARRAVQEYKRYMAGEIKNPPTINSLADHKQAIKDFEAANPEYKDAAQKVYEYGANLWKKKFDAGLISEDTYNSTRERKDYVPFKRDMSDKASQVKMAAGFKDNGKHAGGVHHFDGSNRPILSPLQSIMEDTIRTERVIARNDAMKALVNLARKAGRGSAAIAEVLPRKVLQGQQVDASEVIKARMRDSNLSPEDQQLIVEELTDLWDGDGMTTIFRAVEASDAGENIVYVWEGGERTMVKIGDPQVAMDIHGMMLGLNDEGKAMLTNFFAGPTTVLRMGITNHPMFIATNFIRDQLTTWAQSDAGFIPFLDGFKGAISEITNDKYARMYNNMGGVSGGVNVSAFKKNVIEKDLNRLRQRGIRVRRLNKISEWAKLGDISESATRLGVFARYVKKYKKEGMSDYDAFFEAAYEATDIMDFAMHGAQMNSARRLIPFLNAQIVGLYKTGRVLAPGGLFKTVMPYLKHKAGKSENDLSRAEIRNIERGAKAWAKVSMIGLIGLSLSALHDDDDEYLEFNDYYRATHWVTKIGGEWVLIPKPFELAAMSNLFERSYEAFKLKDKEAFAKFRKGMRDMLTPPMNVPAIGVPIEQKMNKSFFKNMPIVPMGLENYEPYAQYSANTSIMARKLGRALNWSPARIDHVIKAMGGTMGRDFLRSTDALSGQKPALSPSNTPIASRLVKDPNYSSESINKFYRTAATHSGRWHGRAQQLGKAIDNDDAKEAALILSFAGSDDERAYMIANALYKGKKISTRRKHPMQRAKDANAVIAKAQKSVDINEYAGLKLTREQQRDVKDAMQKLEVAMVRNGLKHSFVDGWVQKQHTPEAPILQTIKDASPKAHDALVKALKKKEITPEADIARKYKELKARIRKDVEKIPVLKNKEIK